jgi:tripartite-type tricarboxylate transporter receptor subunit TctC
MADFVPGFESGVWWGLGAPTDTPAAIVDKLNREINAGLADPRLNARLTELGATALPGSPAEFGALIARDTEKWGRIVRAGNMRVE